MGFQRNKTYALRWADGTEFAGLEVEARVLPIGYMEKFGEIIALKDRAEEDFSEKDLDAIVALFDEFARQALVGWNFEVEEAGDDGTTRYVPVPPTPEGMRRVDFEMGIEIINEWFTAATDISGNTDGDLGKDSSPGATSPAVPIPMDPLSPSQVSLTTPS